MRASAVLFLVGLMPLVACNDVPDGAEVAIQPEVPTTVDTLTATLTAEAVDRHELTYSYAWSVDGAEVPDQTGDTVPAEATAKGQVWSVRVTPNDGKVDGVVAEASVTIANSAPTVAVELEPLAPMTGDPLVATADAQDADGDAVTLEWTWTRDGSTVAGAVTDRIAAEDTTKGETWEVTVTPTDGETVGVVASASVVIGNTAPIATAVAIEPSVIDETVIAKAVASGTDSDGDELTWTYVWYVAGGEVQRGADDWIDGDSFARGDTLLVEAIANDGAADSEPVASEIVVVTNAAPSLTGAVIDPGEPDRSSVLSCLPEGAQDLDGDEISYETSWTVDGRIVGSTATLDGTFFQRDQEVTCTLTPSDGTDAGEPVTSEPVTIENTPPTITSVSLTPATPRTADTLAVSIVATDLDDDTITFGYSWTVNGKVAGTASTLTSDNFVKGDTVAVTVTPRDTEDGLPETVSAVISNTAPTAPGITIDPAEPGGDEDLICEVTTASVDADGDRISYSVAWTRDGASWRGGTSTTTISGDTIDASNTADGETWACTVTPSDGTDSGTAGTDSVEVSDALDFVIFTTPTFIGSSSSSWLTSRKNADAKCASYASSEKISGSDWRIVYSNPSENASNYLDYDASRGDRVYDRNGKRIDGGNLWKSGASLADIKAYTITGTGTGGGYKSCSGSYPAGTWPICQYCSKKFACAGPREAPFDPPRCCWTGTRAVVCMGKR